MAQRCHKISDESGTESVLIRGNRLVHAGTPISRDSFKLYRGVLVAAQSNVDAL